MTFLEPIAQLSPVPLPFVPDASDSTTPIIQQLPQTEAAFSRKYSDPDTIKALKRVPKNVRRSIIELDHQRSQKGQYPLSTEQTATTLLAAIKHKPVTQKKEESPWNPLNFLNNAREDIQSLTTEIPKLPLTLAGEVGKIQNLGEEAEKVESLGDIAQLPGVRLLPGSFVASGLLPGGVPAGDLIKHPVMAGLDAAPFAGKLLKTPAGLATRAKVAESAAGQVVKQGAEALASSRVGQATRRAVGQQSRGDARAFNNENLALGDEIAPFVEIKMGTRTKLVPNPKSPTTELGRIAREGQILDLEALDPVKGNLAPERVVELTERMQSGDFSGLNDYETTYINKSRDLIEQTAREANTFLPPDEAIQKVGPSGERVAPDAAGEWYDPKTAAKIFKARTSADQAKALAGIHRRMNEPLAGAEIGMLGSEIRRAMGRQDLTASSSARLAEGYAHNLDAAGIEAGHLFDAVKLYRAKKLDREGLIAAFEDTTKNPVERVGRPKPVEALSDDALRDIRNRIQGVVVGERYAGLEGALGDAPVNTQTVWKGSNNYDFDPKSGTITFDTPVSGTASKERAVGEYLDRNPRMMTDDEYRAGKRLDTTYDPEGKPILFELPPGTASTIDLPAALKKSKLSGKADGRLVKTATVDQEHIIAPGAYKVDKVIDAGDHVVVRLKAEKRQPAATMTKEEILASLPKTRDPQIVRLTDAIKADRYADAAKVARALNRRTKFEVPGITDALDNLSRKSAQQRYIARTGKAERIAELTERRATRLTERSAPARFVPELAQRAEREMAVRLSDGTPENIAQVTRQIVARDFDNIPGFNELEWRALQNEIEGTWTQLKADGFDPVFIHSVPRGGVNSVLFPKIMPKISTPGAMKARTMDWSPSEGSAGVAITHEATQILGRRGAENFLNNRAEVLGRSRAELDEMYRATAERRAGGDPRRVPDELNKLVDRDYGKLDFKGMGISKNAKIAGKFGDADVYVPRNTLKNLDDFMKTAKSPIAAAIDPVMNVFRTAVLPLSPRWQFYNLLGGAMATAIENPFAFRQIAKAYQSIKEGHVNIESDVFRRKVSHSQQLSQEWNHSAGKTGARIMDEVNAARALGKVTSPVRNAFGKAVKWSFDRNEFIDQMFRTMNYLEEEGKALKSGAGKAEAARLGEEAGRKVLADWTELTPVERTVMRYMAPFYSFMQHITRYALRYPVEHPWRTAVIGAFARAEEEDFGTGLPERFLNGFFLGEPDENGNVTQIKLDGLNPFRDVADNFTLAGLLGQSNPIIQTLAEQLGIDTMGGGPELYPTLRYDSMTGRLAAQGGNPVTNLLSNTIPQVELLKTLTGTSQEFKELARTNPESALNLFRSQAGFPILTKNVNVPQEEMKNELALQENQKKVLSDALRSGDYTEASQYPALRPYISQVQDLSEKGKLKQFQLNRPTPQGLSLARNLVPVG